MHEISMHAQNVHAQNMHTRTHHIHMQEPTDILYLYKKHFEDDWLLSAIQQARGILEWEWEGSCISVLLRTGATLFQGVHQKAENQLFRITCNNCKSTRDLCYNTLTVQTHAHHHVRPSKIDYYIVYHPESRISLAWEGLFNIIL